MKFCTHEGPIYLPEPHEHDFWPFLYDFVLVFFGDILIYKKTSDAQVKHVDKALQLLEYHQLFIKFF